MIRLPGKQQDTVKFYHDGNIYYQDKRGSGTIFRCSAKNKNCQATIYVETLSDLENQEIIVNGPHTDAADHFYILKLQFSDELRLFARTTFDDLKAIFDNVKAKNE